MDVSAVSPDQVQALVHELQVHRFELQMQNDELRRTQAELAELRDQYFELFELAPVGYVTIGPEYRIERCNLSAAELLGMERSKVEGAVLAALVAPEDRDPSFLAMRETLESGAPQTCECAIVRTAGTRRHVQLSIVPVNKQSPADGCRVTLTDITRRKLAEERLRMAIDGAHLGIWHWDLATQEINWSDACLSLFGVALGGGIRHATFESAVHPEDREAVRQAVQTALHERSDLHAEYRVVWPDQSTHWLKALGRVYCGSDGEPSRMDGVILDITVRKEAEIALRQANERLELAKQAAGQGIWDWDIVSGQIVWSPEMFRLFGLDCHSHTASFAALEQALHPEDRAAVFDLIDRSLRDHTLFNTEYRILPRGGEIRWIGAMGKAVYDDAGRAVRMTGICMDITDRRAMLEKSRQWNAELEQTVAIRTAELTAEQARTAQALERTTASELRFRTIFEQAPLGLAMINSLTGQIDELNERFAEIAGRTRDEMVSVDWMSLTHPDDLQADLQNMAGLNSGQISGFQMDKRYLRPDGSVVWISMTIAPVAADAGESPRHLCMIEDITDRKEAEDRIRSITDAAQDAIIMMGPRGTITYWNPAAESILGYSAREAIGANLHEQLAPERYRTAFHAAFSEFSRTGRGNLVGKRTELFARRKDGREIPVSLSLTAVSLQGTWHSVGILHDITERLAMEEQIRQWNVELERRVADRTVELAVANAAKSEFLANMSHEIRTPMNGVIGMTGLLLDTRLTSEQRRYAETIRTSGESMLTLINDILDLSRIEAGKLQLETMAFDLRSLLGDCAVLLAPRAREKGLKFTWQAAPEIPSRVSGDPGRLRQILSNLAGNAVKFTDRGEVTVRASLLAQTETDLVIRFAVRDTGIGIPADKQPGLFQRFSQVDASATRRFGGAGLGLAIAKELAELMGGEIGVSSQPGVGSEFWFTIRLRPAHMQVLENASAEVIPVPQPCANPTLQQKRARVLVAEDNFVNQEVAIGILRKLGVRADAVADGTEAIEALKTVPYDLVLMDMQMPELDGLEATRIIRDPQSPVMNHRIPVIAMTANAMRGDRERCLEAGMNDYVSKPVSPRALEEALNKWLPSDVPKTQPVGTASPVSATGTAPEGIIFDRAGLVARLMGDEELADRIQSRFLESTPPLIESLRKSLDSGDAATARRTAHAIKGAAANIGGERLRLVALEMEQAANTGDPVAARGRLAELEAEFDRLKDFIQAKG